MIGKRGDSTARWNDDSALPARSASRTARHRAPETSVSLDWILAQIGPLVDGSVASLRFRENIESAAVSLTELEAWVLQALRDPPDPDRHRAFQDLVQAVGKRLGVRVQYGTYDKKSRGWLPFDGLWWLDAGQYVCVNVFPQRLLELNVTKLLGDLDNLAGLGGVFAQARGSIALVLADGYSADLESALRSTGALGAIRLLGVDTLFDVARMHHERVIAPAQIPVLFSPFDSMRLGQVVDFLERFVARYEETHETAPAAPDDTCDVVHPELAEVGMAAGVSPAGLDAESPRLTVVAVNPGVPGAANGQESPAERHLEAVPSDDRKKRLETLREVYALFKAGRHQECLPLLQEFLSSNQKSPKAWELCGDLSVKLGRHGEAIRAYSQVLELAPPSRRISYRLSRLYESQGDLREAIRVLEDYSRTMPDDAREVRVSIARLLHRAGDHVACANLCEQILHEGPWERSIVELKDQSTRLLVRSGARQAKTAKDAGRGRLGRWVSGLLRS